MDKCVIDELNASYCLLINYFRTPQKCENVFDDKSHTLLKVHCHTVHLHSYTRLNTTKMKDSRWFLSRSTLASHFTPDKNTTF